MRGMSCPDKRRRRNPNRTEVDGKGARWAGWVYLFCASILLGFVQQNWLAGQSEPKSPAPLSGALDSITLDAVVTDQSGKLITNLRQSNFTLLDNGHVQKILSFRAANTGAEKAGAPPEVILVVDQINPPIVGVAVARDAIERFLLRGGGELASPLSLVFLKESGTVRRGPSLDGNALAAAMRKEDFSVGTMPKRNANWGAVDRRKLSLQALWELIRGEATKPGRKIMIWVSPGWYNLSNGLDRNLRQDLFKSVVALSEGTRLARVTVYQVNPWGVKEDLMRRAEYQTFLSAVENPSQAWTGNTGLQAIAYQSGGRIFAASNDVTGEIAACVAEANSFYTFGFAGDAGSVPNEFHSLELKVDTPGLKARTRLGYYSQPEQLLAH